MATFLRGNVALVDGEDIRVTAASGTVTAMVFRAYGAMVGGMPKPPADRVALLEYDQDSDDGEDEPVDLDSMCGELVGSTLPPGNCNIIVRFQDLSVGVSLGARVQLATDAEGEAIEWPANVSFVLARYSRDGVPHVLVGFRWDRGDVPGSEVPTR